MQTDRRVAEILEAAAVPKQPGSFSVQNSPAGAAQTFGVQN